MQYLSSSKHAVSCFHRKAPVLFDRPQYLMPEVSWDGHGQILYKHCRAWSSGDGSSAENENVFLPDGVPDQLYLN